MLSSTDTSRYEALKAALEAERKVWAEERKMMLATIAKLRMKVWRLERNRG